MLKTKEQRAFEAIVSEAASKQGEAAFYTVEAPGEFSAAKHVPTINIEGRKATIVVPHGQLLLCSHLFLDSLPNS